MLLHHQVLVSLFNVCKGLVSSSPSDPGSPLSGRGYLSTFFCVISDGPLGQYIGQRLLGGAPPHLLHSLYPHYHADLLLLFLLVHLYQHQFSEKHLWFYYVPVSVVNLIFVFSYISKSYLLDDKLHLHTQEYLFLVFKIF